MASDVVWLDVLPSLDKFKEQLEQETESASQAAGRDAGSAFSRAFEAASSTSIAQQQAADLEKAAASTKRTVGALTQQIAQARAQEREATAKVVLAEQALADARAKFGQESRQVEAAELKLEAARERVSAASTKTTSVEDQLKAAQREHREVTDQLADATKRLATQADALPPSFHDAESALERMKQETAETNQRFEDMRERFDTTDTRMMGFRDGITGVTDSVAGFKALLSGQGSLGDSLFLVGAGLGDLASSAANLVVPAVKRARDAIAAMDVTLKRTAIGLAVAAAAAVTAFFVFRDGAEDASAEVDDMAKSLDIFVKSGGEATGTLRRWNEQTGGIAGLMRTANSSVADFNDRVSTTDSLLNNITGGWLGKSSVQEWSAAVEDANSQLDTFDQQLADLIRQGASSADVLAALNERYGEHVVETALASGKLDDFKRAMADADEEQRAMAGSTQAATDRLRAFKDELLAQTSPIFAWVSAQQQAKDAQTNLNEAIKEHGPKSKEAKAAQLALAEAQLRAAATASDLTDVNKKTLLPVLEQMVEDGQLSAGAFKELKRKLDEAKSAAERLDGTRVKVTVTEQWIRDTDRRTGGGKLDSFDEGGTVPGPTGAPRVILAHGGEEVLNQRDAALWRQLGQMRPAAIAPPVSIAPVGPQIGTLNMWVPLEDLRQLKDFTEFVEFLRNTQRRGMVRA